MKKPLPTIPPHQRQGDFTRAIVAAEGSRERQQSWQYVAQRLAREPEETAFAAALRRALVEREARR